MASPPDLKIPPSSTTVSVSVIDTTTWIDGIKVDNFITPLIPGYEALRCPAYSFLIEHPSGRRVLFDLGVRKDVENLAPRITKRIKDGGWTITVKKNVREILEENGVAGRDIESIIWSHWHWDHTGSPATFDKTTSLIVGPGFKKNFLPAYPTNPDSPLLESDFEGRELIEITFSGLKIGNFNAYDFFGDGSFFLLDSPGHAIGHMCGLARVQTSTDATSAGKKDAFIFMGGDACHHGGEFRPSTYLPLPTAITPSPIPHRHQAPCPGALFESLLRDGKRDQAFFDIPDLPPEKAVAYDTEEARRTITKVQETDAHDTVLVIMAHDESLLGVLDFFPKKADRFLEKEWVETGRWGFLKDFEKALGKKIS